jgi:hypothetical protein
MPVLRLAVTELAWLLSRGYAASSSLKLVGDRHELRQRQRELVLRATCTDAQRIARAATRVSPQEVAGKPVYVDGFNLLITIEAALGKGLVFKSRDGALRDISSVHGTYRSVAETETALIAIGETLQAMRPSTVTWFFDQPVSNSGRLAQRLRALATRQAWSWEVALAMNPDQELIDRKDGVLVSSDALILDHARHWLALSECVLIAQVPQYAWLDLSVTPDPG